MLSKILRRHFSLWAGVPLVPPDPVLDVTETYKRDPAKNKANLCVGAYQDNDGNPYTLECVKKATQIVHEKNYDNEYLPILGSENFIKASLKLGYGDKFYNMNKDRIAGAQMLSGTGALRIGFEFLQRFLPTNTGVYLSNPTWVNHNTILMVTGFQEQFYRYYDFETKGVNFEAMKQDMNAAKPGSVFLLHASAHNPTGCDLDIDQWKEVRDILLERNHICFLDMAYQGFTSGNLQEDSVSVRILANSGVNLLVSQSFAKSMGLYGQRIGTLSILTDNAQEREQVESQLKMVVRPFVSSPPLHGARIVETILTNPELYSLWQKDIKLMAERIIGMRVELVNQLRKAGSIHDWSHIVTSRGMFAFSGMTPEQVQTLIKDYSIYMPPSGRICIAGLTTKNVEYVAQSIHNVTKQPSFRTQTSVISNLQTIKEAEPVQIQQQVSF